MHVSVSVMGLSVYCTVLDGVLHVGENVMPGVERAKGLYTNVSPVGSQPSPVASQPGRPVDMAADICLAWIYAGG